jgi:hypothetical protein
LNRDRWIQNPECASISRLVQSAERTAPDLVVVGSSPTVGVFAGTRPTRRRDGARLRGSSFPRTLAIVIAIIATTMGAAVMPTVIVLLTIMDGRRMTLATTTIAILSRLVDVLCCPSRAPQAGGSRGRADKCISRRGSADRCRHYPFSVAVACQFRVRLRMENVPCRAPPAADSGHRRRAVMAGGVAGNKNTRGNEQKCVRVSVCVCVCVCVCARFAKRARRRCAGRACRAATVTYAKCVSVASGYIAQWLERLTADQQVHG